MEGGRKKIGMKKSKLDQLNPIKRDRRKFPKDRRGLRA